MKTGCQQGTLCCKEFSTQAAQSKCCSYRAALELGLPTQNLIASTAFNKQLRAPEQPGATNPADVLHLWGTDALGICAMLSFPSLKQSEEKAHQCWAISSHKALLVLHVEAQGTQDKVSLVRFLVLLYAEIGCVFSPVPEFVVRCSRMPLSSLRGRHMPRADGEAQCMLSAIDS